MLAVFTGLGQRRTLLRPLINIRQPRITRRIASLIMTNVEWSNDFSCGSAWIEFRRTIIGARSAVNLPRPKVAMTMRIAATVTLRSRIAPAPVKFVQLTTIYACFLNKISLLCSG